MEEEIDKENSEGKIYEKKREKNFNEHIEFKSKLIYYTQNYL